MKKLLLMLAVSLLSSCATETKDQPRSDVRVFPLKHADAATMMRTLAKGALLEEMATDARTNSIIAKGSEAELDRLEARIRKLDRESF